ncbi:MAG: DUF4391 domain-containing protein [Clostridiales bacterium]|nr:DUF4391 domain-containing protein [Clostridiales bacterium]
MSVEWNDIFRLPSAALAGRRVPKTALTRNARLTRLEQKVLDKVSLIEHWATVQKSSTRIPPHVDEERDIQAVVFLRCELTGRSAAYAELAHVIHPCFPNPTALLFENGGEVCLSCAVTRMSQAERGATVVEDVTSTGGFEPTDPLYAPLLAVLAFDRMPQGDLYEYVRELSWLLRLGRLTGSLGFYPSCAPAQRVRLLELSSERDELVARRNAIAEQRRSRDLTLNETAKLRMEQREVEGRAERALKEINEICSKGATS